MSDLLVGADAAYPFDYSALPGGVSIILGYLGGDTPHAWAPFEIAAAEKTGRTWCGIWTAPSTGQRLDTAAGLRDGDRAAAQLNHLGRPKGLPVFYDIEHASYIADPPGAMAARNGFRTALGEAGYRNAYAYLPAIAGVDWIANWTYEKPAALPHGVIGWQYQGIATDTRFDLSVFDPALFAATPSTGGKVMATLDKDDKAFIVAQLEIVQENLGRKLSAYQWDDDKKYPQSAANVHLAEGIANLQSTLAHGTSAGVDTAALASAIVAKLGPALSAGVVAELSKRLAQ